MKKNSMISLVTLLVLITASLSSCEAIKGIFKAGVWTGVIIVVGIIAVVIALLARGGKK
jgi:hypothetical protein